MEDVKGERERNPEITSTVESECLVLELPQGLMMDIISRLSIKSILNCKCVCKTWFHLISDPYFSKIHLTKSKSSILIEKSRGHGCPLAVQIVEEGNNKPFEIETLKFFPNTNLPESFTHIVNSYNGLVCLREKKFTEKIIYVCNPILGECITIDVHYNDERVGLDFALGFCFIRNQYKILQVFHYPDEIHSEWQAEIYTVGTGQWTSIGNALSHPIHLTFDFALHDSIHWIGYNGSTYEPIIRSFDFEGEQFHQFSTPINAQNHEEKEIISYYLGALEDCLFMACSMGNHLIELEIWVMKEYGVDESWTKNFVIGNISLDRYKFNEPLIFLSSGEILIFCDYQFVVCYDPKTKRVQDTTITKGMEVFKLMSYKPSFVSLQDVAKGEELKVLRLEKPICVERCTFDDRNRASDIFSEVDWARVWFWSFLLVLILVMMFKGDFLAIIFMLVKRMMAEFLRLLS